MFVVTEAVLELLSKEIDRIRSDDPDGACFRIASQAGTALTLELELPESTDEIFEHNGTVVLALPQFFCEAVGDGVLDLDADGGLVLRR